MNRLVPHEKNFPLIVVARRLPKIFREFRRAGVDVVRVNQFEVANLICVAGRGCNLRGKRLAVGAAFKKNFVAVQNSQGIPFVALAFVREDRLGKRIVLEQRLTATFGDRKPHAIFPNVICAVNQIKVVSVRFAELRLFRRAKVDVVKIGRGSEGGRVCKFFVDFGTIIAALRQNFAHDFFKQNRQRAMICMAVEVDAKNYVRPKFKEQTFQIALEIFASVFAVLPESFFRVVNEILRRISLVVTCRRIRGLYCGKNVRVAVTVESVAVAEKNYSFAWYAENFQRVDSLFGANVRRKFKVAVCRVSNENFSLRRRQIENHISRNVNLIVGMRCKNQYARPEIIFVEERIARRQNFFRLNVFADEFK